MYPIGLFECLIGGLFFYFLGKRCRNYNTEYIELNEIQYNSVKDFITTPDGTPPRYNEVEEETNTTINNQNDLSRYNVSNTQNTSNETYQQPLSPPPQFIDNNEIFIESDEDKQENNVVQNDRQKLIN